MKVRMFIESLKQSNETIPFEIKLLAEDKNCLNLTLRFSSFFGLSFELSQILILFGFPFLTLFFLIFFLVASRWKVE